VLLVTHEAAATALADRGVRLQDGVLVADPALRAVPERLGA
jgi:ABC-type lipoprotein export system ATPase subunit